MQIKAVLFDLDGTLVDTEELVRQSFSHALGQQGFPPITKKKQAEFAGIPLSKAYPLLAPEGNIEKLVNDHREFSLKNVGLAKKYPNTERVIKKIRAMKIMVGIVTGRYRKSSEQILKKTGLQKIVDTLVCGDDFEQSKPDPFPYITAAKNLSVKTKDCLVVGDGWVDVVSGKTAGCRVCRAMYGYGAMEPCKEKPDFEIKKIDEIMEFVAGKKKKNS